MKSFTGIMAVISICFTSNVAYAQGFGGFGGAGSDTQTGRAGNQWFPAGETSFLEPELALNYITIDGTAVFLRHSL